ncbi:MAG: DNA-3-methyladenine glycosylase [Bacteroidota bacterium]
MSFYLTTNVTEIAKQLLGKILVTQWMDGTTQGRIIETEAYEGEIDKASHAFKGLTPRTKTMYAQGGTAYVYLCYGIHQMFNVVTGAAGTPHAILIRGVEPIKGVDIMLARTGKIKLDNTLTRGPGNVGRAFGFHTSHCGMELTGKEIFIADDGYEVLPKMIGTSPRIGVDYAGHHAEWHYRFYLKGNKWVSGKVNK